MKPERLEMAGFAPAVPENPPPEVEIADDDDQGDADHSQGELAQGQGHRWEDQLHHLMGHQTGHAHQHPVEPGRRADQSAVDSGPRQHSEHHQQREKQSPGDAAKQVEGDEPPRPPPALHQRAEDP